MIKVQNDVKIKLNKFLLIALFMLISTLNIPFSIVVCMLTGLMVVAYGIEYGKGDFSPRCAGVNRLAIFFAMLVIGYMIFQILILEMNFFEIRQYICAYYAVFLPVFLAVFLSKCFMSSLDLMNVFAIYDILYSLYYLAITLVNGLPDGRTSSLGYVSSNYCACILYMTYPLMLYNLLVKRDKISKGQVKLCLCAAGLSLVVILVSGSRTALGCVAVLVAFLFLLKGNSKEKRWLIVLGILAIIAVFVAYFTVPAIQALVNRALGALGGVGAVKSDSRSVIWYAAMLTIKEASLLIGTGSNIISYEAENVSAFTLPGHNILLEVQLLSGLIGIILFVTFIVCFIYKIWINQPYNKRVFLAQLIVLGILIGMVQPFFSTSYLVGFEIWASIFAIAYDTESVKKK